jgi:hypothetical protein
MKKGSIKSKTGRSNDLAEIFSTATFRKKNKKRLLPDVFYLRWEVELACALIAIMVLVILPDWLNNKVALFLSGYETSMNTEWITIACNILLACFISYIIVRTFWLYFIRTGNDDSNKKVHFARITDHIAEFIFSVCIIILILLLLISLVQFLAIFLNHSVSDKMKNVTGINL